MFCQLSWFKKVLSLLIICAYCCSCQQDNEIQAPDVTNINVEVKLRRFEQDFFALDTNNLEEAIMALENKYPALAPVYFGPVLGANNPEVEKSIGKVNYIRGFLTFPAIRTLFDTCTQVYNDFSIFETSFEQSFKYLKYYFPKEKVPDLTTIISEYSVGAFIYGNQSLAISLDLYLGSDYPYKSFSPTNPNFSAYLTRTFNKDHIVPKTMSVWVDDKLGSAARGGTMLDQMIHNGKKLYILDQLMPHLPDTAVMEFSAKQLNWLKNNERDIWAFFLSENLIYSTDAQKIRKYLNPSPNSPGMPDEAPGRSANWMGYKIVQAFMQKYPETTLTDLIDFEDPQKLMTLSKYKPPRT